MERRHQLSDSVSTMAAIVTSKKEKHRRNCIIDICCHHLGQQRPAKYCTPYPHHFHTTVAHHNPPTCINLHMPRIHPPSVPYFPFSSAPAVLSCPHHGRIPFLFVILFVYLCPPLPPPPSSPPPCLPRSMNSLRLVLVVFASGVLLLCFSRWVGILLRSHYTQTS